MSDELEWHHLLIVEAGPTPEGYRIRFGDTAGGRDNYVSVVLAGVHEGPKAGEFISVQARGDWRRIDNIVTLKSGGAVLWERESEASGDEC